MAGYSTPEAAAAAIAAAAIQGVAGSRPLRGITPAGFVHPTPKGSLQLVPPGSGPARSIFAHPPPGTAPFTKAPGVPLAAPDLAHRP